MRRSPQPSDYDQPNNIIIPSSHLHTSKQLSKVIKYDDNSLYQKMNDLVFELDHPNNQRNAYSTVTSNHYYHKQQPQSSKSYIQKYLTDSLKPQPTEPKINTLRKLILDLKHLHQELKSQLTRQSLKNKILLEIINTQFDNFLDKYKNNQQKNLVFFVGDSFIDKGSFKSSYKEDTINLQWTNKQIDDLKKINKILTLDNQSLETRHRQLNIELSNYKNLLSTKDDIIDSLSKDNNQLNQKLFDYDQTIAQIDLQIQDKVQSILRTKHNDKNPQKHLKKVEELTHQVELLTQKNNTDRHHKQIQFKSKQRQLMIKQRQLQQKQQSLYKKWDDVQHQLQKNMKKQAQLMKLQSQIQRKLGQIKIKQNQIELIKHQLNQNYKAFHNRQKFVDSKHLPQPSFKYNLPLSNLTPNSHKVFTHSYVDSQVQSFKSKVDPIIVRKDQKNSSIANLKQTSKFGINKQLTQTQNINNYVYTSQSKSMARNFQTPNPTRYNISNVNHTLNTQNSNKGIQSKLEKLKSQIRKEIQSIK